MTYAPNEAIDPWAKLVVDDVLKIRTIPKVARAKIAACIKLPNKI
jgi:hypothetical protein